MAGNAASDGGGGGVPWRPLGWGAAAFLLLLPLVAMQFTDEVAWTVGDFLFAAGLMGLVGLTLELTVSRTRSLAYRAGVAIGVAAAFFHIWFTGAVGIIGSEAEDANQLYFGVLAVALAGGVVARFRPAGMARAMVAAAVAQPLVPVAAAVFGLAPPALVWAPEVLGLTGLFVAMWLTSAWLFRKAAA